MSKISGTGFGHAYFPFPQQEWLTGQEVLSAKSSDAAILVWKTRQFSPMAKSFAISFCLQDGEEPGWTLFPSVGIGTRVFGIGTSKNCRPLVTNGRVTYI